MINVEASRAYPRLTASLRKWCVLRTGGRFLCGDFRGRSKCPGWEAALADIQVRQVSERVINPEVLRGMERNSQRSMHPIGRLMRAFMRPFGRRFAGVAGTGLYRHRERENRVPDVLLHQGVNGGVRLSRSPTTGIGPVPLRRYAPTSAGKVALRPCQCGS